MRILSAVRANTIVNKIIRVFLKTGLNSTNRLFRYFIQRWSTSGVIDCHFNGQRFKMFNHCDDGLVNYFFYEEKYEEQADLHLFMMLAKRSLCIADIGANTGLFSVLSGLVNPSADILAFEPYDANALRLQMNLTLNGIMNVRVIREAVGESIGEIQMAVPQSGRITDSSSINQEFSKSIYPEIAWSSKTVKIRTLDNIFGGDRMPIDLIKCDVESFEMSVFKGADEILRTHRPTILFECFLDEERRIFFNDILAKYDYYVYLILSLGIVHSAEGMVPLNSGLNYILSPKKPDKTFIQFCDERLLVEALLERPI